MPKDVDIRKYSDVRLGLKGARKNIGLTQEQLAKKVPIARSIITELELGLRNTSMNTWIRLGEILMVDNIVELYATYNYENKTFVGSNGIIIPEEDVITVRDKRRKARKGRL